MAFTGVSVQCMASWLGRLTLEGSWAAFGVGRGMAGCLTEARKQVTRWSVPGSFAWAQRPLERLHTLLQESLYILAHVASEVVSASAQACWSRIVLFYQRCTHCRLPGT